MTQKSSAIRTQWRENNQCHIFTSRAVVGIAIPRPSGHRRRIPCQGSRRYWHFMTRSPPLLKSHDLTVADIRARRFDYLTISIPSSRDAPSVLPPRDSVMPALYSQIFIRSDNVSPRYLRPPFNAHKPAAGRNETFKRARAELFANIDRRHFSRGCRFFWPRYRSPDKGVPIYRE